MSDWLPIETAPVGVKVRLGWWEDHSYFSHKENDMRWRTIHGVAYRMEGIIFKRAVPTYDGEKATHWQPLPDAPEATA